MYTNVNYSLMISNYPLYCILYPLSPRSFIMETIWKIQKEKEVKNKIVTEILQELINNVVNRDPDIQSDYFKKGDANVNKDMYIEWVMVNNEEC